MNFNQLNIFYTVAKRKSFSIAALDLYLTQPAVTMQVNLLEDSFGIKLIERMGRRIELTDAGKVLYSYAEQIFKLAREGENVIADYRSLDKGLLKINTTRTIADYYIPEILNRFIKRYPNIKIHLMVANSQEAVDGVLDFTSDVAIVGRVDYSKKLSVTSVFEDQLVLIGSPNSRLFEKGRIEFKELDGKPFIMREVGSGTRKLLLELFKKEGISPNIIMEVGNCDVIKGLVGQGIGLSILTWTMVKDGIERGFLRVIPFSDMELVMIFDFVFHSSRKSSYLVQAFKDLALKVLPRSN